MLLVQQLFDKLLFNTYCKDRIYSQFSFVILALVIFLFGLAYTSLGGECAKSFCMQEKPWASGEENAYNIIKHGVIVLYGHLFVLQKKCSSLYLVALIKHLFYYKEMSKETIKKYILIIKYLYTVVLGLHFPLVLPFEVKH